MEPKHLNEFVNSVSRKIFSGPSVYV